MLDDSEFDDCDDEYVARVSFTGAQSGRHCTGQKVRVCMLPLKVHGY